MENLIIITIVVLCALYIIWRHIVISKQNKQLIQSVTSLSRGTASERRLVLTLLKSGIHPQTIFHDLYVSKNNGKFSQIDLVVATKVGIIVFEVKDYSGWIYGNANQTKWTQVLSYGDKKYRFYNPIMQNNTHIQQLRQKLKENVPFYSVVVFYGNSELKDISFIPRGTYVTKGHRVVDVVNAIIQENPLANYKDKHKVIQVLKDAVTNGDNLQTEKQHVENIKDMLGTDRIFQ